MSRILALFCVAAIFAGCASEPEEKPAEPADLPSPDDAAVGRGLMTSGPPNTRYPAQGIGSLTDGRVGSSSYMDSEWLGYWHMDPPFEATIDLGEIIKVRKLAVHVLADPDVWIFYPRSVEFAVSPDGNTFKTVGTARATDDELNTPYSDTTKMGVSDLNETGRYIRVKVERYGALPTWHKGYGGADGEEGEAWLFIDEIMVNSSK